MKKLLLLATSVTAYYLLKSKQKNKNQQPFKKEPAPIKTVTPENKEMNADSQQNKLVNDFFSLSGEYRWTFYLGSIKQTSTHIFTEDYIDYRMSGKAHSTDYRLQKLSYDAEQHKWIGKTDDDLVYVLFFKTDGNDGNDDNNGDEQITTYKHKCGYGDEGIAEAMAFAYPADDATADHGWNVYSRENTNEPQDILPFSGGFLAETAENDSAEKISITDSQVTWAGKTYQKLTHHTGERRWVGQLDDECLVLFYELNKSDDEDELSTVSIALQTYEDIEEAYQSKHTEQKYANFNSIDEEENIKTAKITTETLISYKVMPEWTNETLPKGFRNKHNTKVGTWAKLTVLEGKLKYYAMDEAGEVTDTFIFDSESEIPFVEPQAWHKVKPLSDDLRCQLSFYCLPADYYQTKYDLSATHSEVIEILQIMQVGKQDDAVLNDNELKGLSVLDLGCGSGRNSLYLQSHGFDVTGFDKNESSMSKLQTIIEEENLEHITANIADLNKLDDADEVEKLGLTGQYDLAISTVVLMFLEGNKVPAVIDTMQQNTKIGGYNLIVCAIDSEDYPYPNYEGLLPFHFGFKTGELSDYYKDWDIVKYNENVGHLPRLDNEGNPIALRFATLIAKKVEKVNK